MNGLSDQLGLLLAWLGNAANWRGTEGIPTRFLEHAEYSGLALLIAALIALPLGMLVGHTGRGGFIVISIANVARALPTLGLVVLAVTIASIGLVPVLVPLVALAVPPILVNTYAGIRAVDGDVKDAARGMGMTGWRVLRRVEAPVAGPLILLGLRTAAIQVVATATIAAYAGLGGLGRYIVDGLARNQYELVVGGSVLVVVLAVLVQFAFFVLRHLFVPRGLRAPAGTS